LSAGWKGTCRVRANHELSRVSVSFDETNLVPNAGLLPAAVLAQRLDLAELIDRRLRLTRHGANSSAKRHLVAGRSSGRGGLTWSRNARSLARMTAKFPRARVKDSGPLGPPRTSSASWSSCPSSSQKHTGHSSYAPDSARVIDRQHGHA
jgi:hypothetical protein